MASPATTAAMAVETQPAVEAQPAAAPPGLGPSGEKSDLAAAEQGAYGDAPPGRAVEALARWNSSRINVYRTLATFWSFLIVGMNDGSYGVS